MDPVALTLFGEDLYTRLVNAASSDGSLTLSDGSKVNPAECFATLGESLPIPIQNYNTLIIVNGLFAPLNWAGVWMKHCDQTQYPAVTGDGPLPVQEMPNNIPGRRPHPLTGSPLYGAGVYQFSRQNWFDNDGALEFYGEGPLVGISWSGTDFGVAADMGAYNSDLQTFYNQTADVKTVAYSESGNVWIRGALYDHNAPVFVIAVGYK